MLLSLQLLEVVQSNRGTFEHQRIGICYARQCVLRISAAVAGMAAAQASAQFHALHLLSVMTELLPDWLPEELFTILYARWKSPERLERCARV